MKKLLIASTALSLAGGAAFAEMAFTLSGDAKMGVDYNSEAAGGKSKHEFKHEVGVDFTGSGTTDGGLTFGGSAGFDTNDDMVNLGTVHVSGSFGTLTIGDNDPASLLSGGIADIGLNGIDVDDKVEDLREGTAAQLRYDNSFGQIKIAISAGTSAAVEEMDAVYRMVPEITIPNTGSDPTSATEWYVVDRRSGMNSKVVHIYADLPTIDQFDPLYGLVAVSTDRSVSDVSVTHDHDDDEDTAVQETNIFGIGYNDDGELTAADGTTDATPAQEAAYDLYIAAYNLGDDGRVGGVTAPDAKEGDMDADTVKEEGGAVTTNAMEGTGDIVIPAGTVDDILISEAVEGKDSETQYAFGMSFEAGGVTIGVGYDSNKTVSMGAGFSAGEVSTNLLYVKTDDDTTGMGVDMTYTMGASAVTLAYGRQKPEEGEATDAVGMGVTHDLGGGATMNAGFGKVDESNKASIGLSFAF